MYFGLVCAIDDMFKNMKIARSCLGFRVTISSISIVSSLSQSLIGKKVRGLAK